MLDELADAGVLRQQRLEGIEYPIWFAAHELAEHRPDGLPAVNENRPGG